MATVVRRPWIETRMSPRVVSDELTREASDTDDQRRELS